MDRSLVKALGFTMALVGLVVAAIGADWHFTLSALAVCSVGFGFFYLLMPGGLHFGMTLANFLAVYACIFVFFEDANFHAAPDGIAVIALVLPVAAFLGGCFVRRRRIATAIRARRMRELEHLPRLTRWVPYVFAVGALSFAVPEFNLSPSWQGVALLLSMAAIALTVAVAVRDVVLLLMDVALIFEHLTRRLNRLVMPVVAFLTLYSLVIVVFACLYRIADLTSGSTQFTRHGEAHPMDFAEAVYFSVITLATVGYGDFAPAGPLVRVLSGIEVVAGLMLLLFGFSEIMRSGGPDAARGLRRRTEAELQADPDSSDEASRGAERKMDCASAVAVGGPELERKG